MLRTDFISHMKTQFKLSDMKNLSYFLLLLSLLTACSKSDDVDSGTGEQPGYLTGIAKDAAGKPLRSVHVIVDHTILHNSNMTTYTNPEGKYKVKVADGSWRVYAKHQVNYHGKFYTFYLHPENPAGVGGEGGVRNFEWKLTGPRPEPLQGEYGGLVTIDHYPGVFIDDSKIEFTLTPDGPLVDKSAGKTLKMKAEDGYNLKDIPVGRYQVTATYEGKPVKLRKWNSEEEFKATFQLDFLPSIPAQCDNCAKIEYYFEQ
jgi:hypothetical protein